MTKPATSHLSPIVWVACVAALVMTVIVCVAVGSVAIPVTDVVDVIASHLPWAQPIPNSPNATIIWELRLPRVLLAMLAGSMLATAGCAYQGTFRNPLADPYLLGVSAGAGLGATIAIVSRHGHTSFFVPFFSFTFALGAVAVTYALGHSTQGGRSSATLLLSGVAVASLLTSIQTLIQQRNADKIREVYSWVLGRLGGASWDDLRLTAPYIVGCLIVLYQFRRVLDVFSIGDDEAATLGLPVAKTRAIIIVAASLGTAAAVSVTGLIGFVGIVVPHVIRLRAGSSYRKLVPLSILLGGIFLMLSDLTSRTLLAPQEIPIGVVTALIGAPFFLYILGTSKNRDAS